MQYKVLKDFKGSPDGGRVVSFTEGQICEKGPDLTSSLIETALAEKWIAAVKQEKKTEKPKGKAK